jgi:hypothetical protein
MNKKTVFLTYDQSLDLVDRIAKRTERFNHTMADSEKEAMAQLFSDIGVSVDDIIDVSNLADNYAINAEIVTPDEADNYSYSALQDALFSWEHDGEKYYCLSW